MVQQLEDIMSRMAPVYRVPQSLCSIQRSIQQTLFAVSVPVLLINRLITSGKGLLLRKGFPHC
jgi:hypothetical protein